DPQRLAPLHALPAHHQVAQRFAQHVPYGERARYVGRRDQDDERAGRRALDAAWLEHAALLPYRVPVRLDASRIVGLLERRGLPGHEGLLDPSTKGRGARAQDSTPG